MALADQASDWLAKVGEACAVQERPLQCPPRDASPVHTVYWPADRFDANTPAWLGSEARRYFDGYAGSLASFASAFGFDDAELAHTVRDRVVAKLATRPVEDIRIDFEDGYGRRSDAEENGAAVACGRAVAHAHRKAQLSARYGIRVKAFTAELGRRSLETLERFVDAAIAGCGELPPGCVVTLPKITVVPQVSAVSELLGTLEQRIGVAENTIGLEVMIEVPQAVFDGQGQLILPAILGAGGRRLLGVHLGVYDYTAAHEVTALHQAMDHPACDLVRGLMRMVYSGSGRELSAGSTNVLPLVLHPGDADELTNAQKAANVAAVHRGWRLAHDQILHTLRRSYYHGWDLHPAQIPARFTACFRFFLESHAPAAERLRKYLAAATGTSEAGGVLDDVATGQALLNMFVRGRACGAFDDDDVAAAGVTPAELDNGSFAELLARRGG